MEISSTLTQKIYVDFYMFMQKKNIKTFKIKYKHYKEKNIFIKPYIVSIYF